MTIALYSSQREIHTVASREALIDWIRIGNYDEWRHVKRLQNRIYSPNLRSVSKKKKKKKKH